MPPFIPDQRTLTAGPWAPRESVARVQGVQGLMGDYIFISYF